MKKRKQREYERRIRHLQDQEQKAQSQLTQLARGNPDIIAEIIEDIPEDTASYKGVFQEIARRLQEGQIKKTVRATRERIEEGKKLWQELAALHRAKADVERAFHEFRTVGREVNLREKQMDVDGLRLERDELQLQKEIDQLKKPQSKADRYRERKEEEIERKKVEIELQGKEQIERAKGYFVTKSQIQEEERRQIEAYIQQFMKEEGKDDVDELTLEKKAELDSGIKGIKDQFFQIYARM